MAAGADGLLQPSRPLVRSMLAGLGRSMADDLRVWALVFNERELGPGF